MKKYLAYGALVIAVIVGIVFLQQNSNTSTVESGTYTAFAQCLESSGARFYGAYWCPHCADQKEMFGDAEKDLPYIECALPGNPNVMTQECKDAGIEGYPTWVFADGSRASGTQSFEMLADKTGCVLPNGGETSTVNIPEDINASSDTNASGQ